MARYFYSRNANKMLMPMKQKKQTPPKEASPPSAAQANKEGIPFLILNYYHS
jgi:hypothetical protein